MMTALDEKINHQVFVFSFCNDIHLIIHNNKSRLIYQVFNLRNVCCEYNIRNLFLELIKNILMVCVDINYSLDFLVDYLSSIFYQVNYKSGFSRECWLSKKKIHFNKNTVFMSHDLIYAREKSYPNNRHCKWMLKLKISRTNCRLHA